MPLDFDNLEDDNLEDYEAMQRKRAKERDPDYQEFEREMRAARREPTEREQEAIEKEAQRKKDIWRDYSTLREEISEAMERLGISDFELYGAGGEQDEMLSALEYMGALRAVGPADPRDAGQFIDTVARLARKHGFKIDIDRPPSVTHLFGKAARSRHGREAEEIAGRPFLYIYKTYRTEWPSEYEREMARQAGIGHEEAKRLWKSINVYEDMVPEIAREITDDPHTYNESVDLSVAKQIGATPEFKTIREEIKDAASNAIDLHRAIHMPISIGGGRLMVYFLAESRNTHMFVDIIGCPPTISEKAAKKLSEMMAF